MVNDRGWVVADPLALEEQPVDEFDFLLAVRAPPSVPKRGLESTKLLEDLASEPHAGSDEPAREQEGILQQAGLVFFHQGQPRQQVRTTREPARHGGLTLQQHSSSDAVETPGGQGAV